MHRHGQDVVVDLPVRLLVEVVADPRRVAEQLLDRHGVVDQGQVVVQDAAHGRVEPESAVIHERQHRRRRERLAPAGHAEPGVDRVRYAVGAVRHAVGGREDRLAVDVDGDHP